MSFDIPTRNPLRDVCVIALGFLGLALGLVGIARLVERPPAPGAQAPPAPTPRVLELTEQNRKLREAHALCDQSRKSLDEALRKERSK